MADDALTVGKTTRPGVAKAPSRKKAAPSQQKKPTNRQPDALTTGPQTRPGVSRAPKAKPGTARPSTPAAPAQPSTVVDEATVTAFEVLGWMAVFLDDPSIGHILRQAADERWTKERLQAALYQTDWWKTHGEAWRSWFAKERLDPATAAQEIAVKVEDLRSMLAELNVSIPDSKLKDIARAALALGWSDDQVLDALYAESKRDPSISEQIMRSSFAEQVRNGAASYGVPLSEQSVSAWATQLALGQASGEQLQAWLSQAAKSLYPWLGEQIDRGLTVKDIASPYIELAARVLERSPYDIDLSDPLWNPAINAVDEAGNRRAMTLAEWARHLRRDERYGWEFTEDAKARAYALADKLRETFGR